MAILDDKFLTTEPQGTTPEAISDTNVDISDPLTGQSVPDVPVSKAPVIVDSEDLRGRISSAQDIITEIAEREALKAAEPKKAPEPTLESVLLDTEEIAEAEIDIFEDFQEQLANVKRGRVPFTRDEQASIEALEAEFARTSKNQKILNQQRTGFQRRLASRSGRSRFAPELAEQEISGTIQAGIDKLNDLDIKAAGALGDARQAIRDKQFLYP